MDNKGLGKSGEQMLTCKYCDQQVKYKSHLIDHEKTHTGEREFMCDWKGCNFRSHRKFNVAQHKITHTEEKPFTCDYCTYRSAHKTHLRVHVRKHNNSKPYICDLCGFKTSYCNALKEHKRNKHTDPSLKCKVCKYVAFGEVDLKNHTCKESLCCGECGYKTHTRPNFIRHKEVHNTVLYSCSLCRTRKGAGVEDRVVDLPVTGEVEFDVSLVPTLPTTKALIAGVDSQIRMDNKGLGKSENQMPTCRYCGKQVKYKSHLIDHEKTHTGEREFMCDWKGCNFRSNRKHNVVQHKITHTEEKPFSCDHCTYKSSHKTHLTVHMRKHNKSKPYICDQCGFKTSYCNSLNAHKRNKHTDPALKCKVCKYVAYGEVDLKNHICKESLCCGVCGYKTHTRPNFIRHKKFTTLSPTPALSVERRVSPRPTSPLI
ncbi:NRG1 [Cordylochernes scorpioides]|uniref:NRG1 n=1 Tax=Cordylochernes scorpioides TaxID=51811 RepID=A0ABY6KD47_9ARAC|nr:NRG1 [Cordylochernes scorpioides]